ncbi:unnamed protein product [Protopolystoma xenopodis]|uniref:Uncharacterized protein n=1 Tax=Protopolystoma xenopodis TaxID=117903 RepID=A0A3S5ACE0_9PLAT|nr:unnamed protein product [Protopolystoma xenopodis]
MLSHGDRGLHVDMSNFSFQLMQAYLGNLKYKSDEYFEERRSIGPITHSSAAPHNSQSPYPSQPHSHSIFTQAPATLHFLAKTSLSCSHDTSTLTPLSFACSGRTDTTLRDEHSHNTRPTVHSIAA